MADDDVMTVSGQDQQPDAPNVPPAVFGALTQQQQPDLGQPTQQPTLAPQPIQRPGGGGMPLLAQALAEVFHPPTQYQAPGPGQIAVNRPVSRAGDFENFLGTFFQGVGMGFANEGHGPGAAMRGAGAAMLGPQQYAMQRAQFQQQQQLGQAQLAQTQAQTGLTQTQAQQAGTMATIDIPGMGQMSVPVNQLGGILGKVGQAETTGQFGLQKANIQAQTKLLTTAMMNPSLPLDPALAAAAGHPEWANQQIGKAQLSALTNEINTKTKLVGTNSTGQEIREDADGNLIKIPVTTTKRPNLPTSMQPPPQAAVPQGPFGQPTPPPPSGFPRRNAPAGSQVVAQGKTAADVGKAFDPQSGDWIETTRGNAPQQGLQQFTKYTGSEQENYRQLNNRLTDVAVKMTRYENSLNQPIGGQDLAAMQSLLGNDKFRLGLGLKVGDFGGVGFEVPVDQLNQAIAGIASSSLSPAAKNRLISYANARESLQGYQRVLTGGSHSSETGLQLQLAALPSPVMNDNYTRMAIDQFKENIRVAGQGLPRQLGMRRAQDVLAPSQQQPQGFSQAPSNLPQQMGFSQ